MFFYFILFLLYSYSYLFLIVFLEYFGKPYLIDPHKIKNYGITCNRVVFIRTLIPSKKQAIEVLYSTYMDSIYILLKTLFLLLLILHLNKILSLYAYAVPIQHKSLLFQFKFLYFLQCILFLTFILTTLYRTNIIHRDKQLYLFPSHRFSFLPVDSNDGFVGLDLIPGFFIEKWII